MDSFLNFKKSLLFILRSIHIGVLKILVNLGKLLWGPKYPIHYKIKKKIFLKLFKYYLNQKPRKKSFQISEFIQSTCSLHRKFKKKTWFTLRSSIKKTNFVMCKFKRICNFMLNSKCAFNAVTKCTHKNYSLKLLICQQEPKMFF